MTAGFGFTGSAEGSSVHGVFYEQNGSDYVVSANPALTLATAVGTLRENAPSGTIYFGIAGSDSAITADGSIGTITVTIAKSNEN